MPQVWECIEPADGEIRTECGESVLWMQRIPGLSIYKTSMIKATKLKSLLLLFLSLYLINGHAQYRCNENGKTVYTDRPCASAELPAQANPGQTQKKVIGDAGNSAYSTTSGAWRGQVQYQATWRTTVDSDAHAIIPMTIEIDPQGKVSGASPENGCTLKGISAPGGMPTITNLDVTFSGCNYAAFNRRMSGYLALYQAQKHAQLSLSGYEMMKRPAGTFEIKGTLRR